MKSITSFCKLSLITIISCVPSIPSLAQSAKIDEQAPDISKLTTAEEILQKACNLLKDNRQFSVQMDITYDNVLTTGEKVQFAARQTVKVNKPDRIFSEYIGDERYTEFRYDGKEFTLYSPLEKFYVTKETDTTLDQALSNIEANYGVTIPLSNLFISDPCTKIFTEATQVRFIGYKFNIFVYFCTSTYFLILLQSHKFNFSSILRGVKDKFSIGKINLKVPISENCGILWFTRKRRISNNCF